MYMTRFWVVAKFSSWALEAPRYFKVTRQQAAMIKLVPRPRTLQLIAGVTLQRMQEHPSLFTRQRWHWQVYWTYKETHYRHTKITNIKIETNKKNNKKKPLTVIAWTNKRGPWQNTKGNKKIRNLVAPQLATVDVTLNAFYDASTLSPTTRSIQKLYLFIMDWKRE